MGSLKFQECSREMIKSPFFQFAALFLLLLFFNFDSLTAPPFWDDIIGLHTQSVWLARNQFDLQGLISAPRSPGSPLYNLFSPMAYIYAAAYRFTTPEATRLLAHMLNIASIAGCGVLLWRMAGKTSVFLKILCLAGALSCPLTVSACAGMGQESLLAFLIFLSLFLKFKRCAAGAWSVSVISWFFKLTGALLTLAYLCEKLFLCVRQKKVKLKNLAFCLFVAVAAIGYYLWHFSGQQTHFKWKIEDVFSLICNAYWSLLPLFAAALLLNRKRIWSCRLRGGAAFVLLFWCANFFSSMAALPRYGTVIVFPVFYLLGAGLRRISLKSGCCIAGIVLVFHLCNLYGTFLPAPRPVELHDGSFMERSREFTIMRSQDAEFCRLLEREKGDRPLVCTWPMLQMLTVPEFGYVASPLKNVYAGEYTHPLGNFKKMNRELLKQDPLFIFTPDCYSWKIPRNARIVFASNQKEPLKGYLIWQLR